LILIKSRLYIERTPVEQLNKKRAQIFGWLHFNRLGADKSSVSARGEQYGYRRRCFLNLTPKNLAGKYFNFCIYFNRCT